MKAWLVGDSSAAAKVDPTLAAVFGIVVEIMMEWDLHTKLGVSPETLLKTLVGIAILVTLVRSYQANVHQPRKALEALQPAVDETSDKPEDPGEPDEADSHDKLDES